MNKREKKAQRSSIETLLVSIEKKYLTREKMYNRILHNRESTDPSVINIIGRMDIVDSVRQNVRTSLQFDDYRRATWYLQLLLRLCEKYFN
ncbi:MAG: hypothetical protein IJ862_03720 [Selenomonadaceae bacterium]|nr:hypothetical protein [Selenomonadaceae bacterium]